MFDLFYRPGMGCLVSKEDLCTYLFISLILDWVEVEIVFFVFVSRGLAWLGSWV